MGVTSEIREGLSTLRDLIQNLEERSTNSLTAYSKKSMIISRIYIDDALNGEDVLKDITSICLDLYCGFIMTAMNMNMYISKTTKVRDLVSEIATESFDESQKPIFTSNLISGYFGDFSQAPKSPIMATNSDFDNDIRQTEERLYGPQPESQDTEDNENQETPSEPFQPISNNNNNNRQNSDNESEFSIKSPYNGDLKTVNDSSPVAVGRIVKCDFKIESKSIPIFLHVQINPRYVPSEVIRQFVKASCPLSFKQRWMQMTAGEISFLTDLIMGCDIRREKRSSLKKDNTGILKELFSRQTESLIKSFGKLTQISPNSSSNIANSILVFEKSNFVKACGSSSIKFTSYVSRQRFFDKTFCMMVIVVDIMFSKVEIYFNGIDSYSVFTFDQLKKKQKLEGADIVSMMRSYASSTAPKF